MRNFLLLLIAGLFSSVITAQHQHELSCSKAKAFEKYYKSTKDVPQTPLLFDYDVKHYFLDIEVSDNSTYVEGDVTYTAEVTAAELDTFAFELLDEMMVDDVLINGISHSVIRNNDEGFVPLSDAIDQGELFTAKITYHGSPPSGGFFSGITSTYDNSWSKYVTWTLSEPFAARDWWPAKQVLEDKADSVWVFLTTDEANMAGSNGLLTDVVSLPDDKVRYEWKSNYPIAYYLISFAVAEFQEYNIYAHPAEMMGDSILVQNFIYDTPGCLQNYQNGIDQTAEFIELFSDLYSLYPFHQEKYGHCLTDLGGGMEHQTMSTMGGFGFTLVAHELGHMWFGDNVTCATWSDIWINEGFATYSEYLAIQNIQGQGAANSEMNYLHSNIMSQPGGSVYVPEDEVTYDNVWRIFNGRLSYNKGSAIIHMIRYMVDDDELFFEALQNFQSAYKDDVATGLDFMESLNQTTGMDFTAFFDEWYFGEGYPTYSIEWSQDDANLYLEVSQSTSMPSVTPFFSTPLECKFFFYTGGDTTLRLELTDAVNSFMFPIGEEIGLVQIDPDNWIINQNGSVTVSVKEQENNAAFKLSPNPAYNTLYITMEQPLSASIQVEIYDLAGTLIRSEKLEHSQEEIDVRELVPGSYLIQVQNGNRQYSQKFIKAN